MPNPPNLCPNCKAPIPPDAPAGLCPACLLLGAAAPTQPMPGALAAAPSMEAVAAAFPELEILELFGHGGMGVIFKARQAKLDRLVALKILPPDLARQPGFTERFTREARALARLNHPHIVSVFDFGERAGFCFLLMEFVNGVNLRQAMRSGVTPQQALSLVPGICEALQFAHDHGVLHRDIKPENILLDTRGQPKLADFGIAKMVEEKVAEAPLTMSGAALGTAAYMAPEQIEQPALVDHRADIYSLGVVLYEMLTGELPLGRFAAPSSKAKVSHGVDEVVFRALEKERERRQQSATEMKTQVEHAGAAKEATLPFANDKWVLRCPSCGHIRPFAEVGIRIGAASIGKRVLARCPACGFTGFTPVIPAEQARTEAFVPDPQAGEHRGRAAAIIGVILSALPLALLFTLFAQWLGTTVQSGSGRYIVEFFTGFGHSAVEWVFIPAILVATLGHLLTIIALWGARYRAPWFFWWLVFYGALTAPLVVGVAILITVLSRRNEFFYAPDAPMLRAGPVVPDAAPGQPPAAPTTFRGMTGVFLFLAIITSLLVPLAAISPVMRNITSPATLSYFVAIFGALFALWPVMVVPSRRDLEARQVPRETNRLPFICGLISLPLALLFLAVVIPQAMSRGFSPWLVVIFSIGIPVFAAAAGSMIAAAWRAMRCSGRTSSPAGIVAVLVIAALCIAIFAINPWRDRESRRSPTVRYEGYNAAPVISAIAADQSPSVASWAQGSAELVAVARHPSKDGKWWRMDGTEAREGPFLNTGQRVYPEKDERAFEFCFRARNLPPGASQPIWLIQNYRSSSTGGIPELAKQPGVPLADHHIIAATLPANLTKTNAKAGLAYEPWHTISASHPRNSTEVNVTHEGVLWKVTHGTAVEAKNGEVVAVFNYPKHLNWETRVIAVTNDGIEVEKSMLSRLNDQGEFHFEKVPLSSVKEFQFQVRPIRWVEFRDISLQPLF